VAQVRAALAHHLVLFFLDQDLSPEVQTDFARQFGEVTPAHPVIDSLAGHPMWVSLQAAYDGLSAPVRAFCDGLIAWHHDPWFAADVDANGGYEWDGKRPHKLPPASPPEV